MQRITVLGSLALLTLGMSAGCGGDSEGDGPGGGGFSLPDSAVLGDLTDAQKETLCTETKAFMTNSGLEKDFVELSCRLSGFMATIALFTAGDAELQAACTTAYDACVADQMGAAMCTPPTATCRASVGEYKACLNEADTLAQQNLPILPPCNQLTRAKSTELIAKGTSLIPQTPACDAFQAKCPDADVPTPDLP